ncbi:ABC transporter ATP-binding protein [Alienimonas californiensis]|uniref:Putative ABC transporter ATP-binding protein YbhF n=1 Tax=Alienimonas californiensis TaxID=2527989 RepID=A0A517P5T8_9PLAN|nr:ABC transporter ATP-binding protein [Alienimonas californiensis]QDT14737.1 putative ABC transporter ATP-binding protein YbhF [Alienimonas californiensis]
MLEAVELTKTYGRKVALDGLNLTVRPGDVFCLLGANGAGKSTTIKLLLGLIPPTSGEVRINGAAPRRGRGGANVGLGYIPEQVSLYPRLSGLENLRYFASLAGESDLTRARLTEALEAAGLPADAVDRRVSNYSKGMRQKVVIALAVVRQVRGLLLDEPTSGLDPLAAREFGRLLRDLSGRGVAILMASHDLHHIRELATRIGVMKGGRLMEELEPTAADRAGLETRLLQFL